VEGRRTRVGTVLVRRADSPTRAGASKAAPPEPPPSGNADASSEVALGSDEGGSGSTPASVTGPARQRTAARRAGATDERSVLAVRSEPDQ
jgi:hypothetical protein